MTDKKPPIPESEVRAFGKDNVRYMLGNYFDRYSLDFIREFRKILDWYVIKRDFDLPKEIKHEFKDYLEIKND